jgi:5,10-methylenetetrahydrofolate reductase
MLETGQKMENTRLGERQTMQTLKDKLATGRFVITAEIAPPATCDAGDLVTKAAPLKGLADAVNVTDGAGVRSRRRRSCCKTASSRFSSSRAATGTAWLCKAR